MKKLLTICCVFTTLMTIAQTPLYKKIGQRHDIHNGSTWQGADSFRWAYTGALLNMQNGLKTTTSGNWNDLYRYTYTYNANDLVASQVLENWNGSTWVNSKRYTYDYDVNSNLTVIHYDSWSGSTWNPTGKIEYTGYNFQHKYGAEIYYIWSGGAWMNLSKDVYQYYTNGYQVQNLERYDWNSTYNQWDSLDRWAYAYNADSLASLIKMVPHAGNWLQSTREIYTYSSSPFVRTEYSLQNYDTSVMPPVWKDDRKIVYTYNAADQLLKTFKTKYTAIGWMDEARDERIYNASNQLIEYFNEIYLGAWSNNTRNTFTYSGNLLSQEIRYEGLGSGWNETKKLSYLYDALDSMTFREIDTFNGATFIPNNRDFYYYAWIPTSTNDLIKSVNGCTMFPNPTVDVLNLEMKSEKQFQSFIRILDITGKCRMMIVQPVIEGKNRVQITTSALPAGNYFIQLSNEMHATQFAGKFQIIR